MRGQPKGERWSDISSLKMRYKRFYTSVVCRGTGTVMGRHSHKQKAQMNVSVAQFCLGKKKKKGSMMSLVYTGLVLVIRAATSRFSVECLVGKNSKI